MPQIYFHKDLPKPIMREYYKIKNSMNQKTHTDTAYCPFCDGETQHLYISVNHERDSSNDKEICLSCNAYRYGISNEWNKGENIS